MTFCGMSRENIRGITSVSHVVIWKVSRPIRFAVVSNAEVNPNEGAKPSPCTRMDVSIPSQGKLVKRFSRALYFFGALGRKLNVRQSDSPLLMTHGNGLPEHSATVNTRSFGTKEVFVNIMLSPLGLVKASGTVIVTLIG